MDMRTPDRYPSDPPPEPEKEGGAFVYKVSRLNMTITKAETLARVIRKCSGRGSDVIHIRDESGSDLLGHPIRVAWPEFRLICQYEGL